MKMRSSKEEGIGRTVIVGVDMDDSSRELLSWALLRVAGPGDRVVALHVLHRTELMNKEGKPSLFSLVKVYESAAAVYEGLCSSKQIDLKFKICRGSSVRRVLVRAAKSISADIVVVGISNRSCIHGFSASVAKYCARKLPLECWILAANHGKVEFQRGSRAGYVLSGSIDDAILRPPHQGVLATLLHKRSQKSEVSESGTLRKVSPPSERKGKNQSFPTEQEADSDSCSSGIGSSFPSNSSIESSSTRTPYPISRGDSACFDGRRASGLSFAQQREEAESDSLAISTCVSPMVKPGWPFLHKEITHNWQAVERSVVSEISHMLINHEPRNLSSELTTISTTEEAQQVKANLDRDGMTLVLVESVVQNSLAKQLQHLSKKRSPTFKFFSYQELQSATSKFSTDKLIWNGPSSQVYRGRSPDGKEIAIKILKPSKDATKEFCLEIEIMRGLCHETIAALLGFCFEENKLILVHDFALNGSLEENLHGKRAKKVLSWGKRFKVATGTAAALDYLHNGTTEPVIHRDVKSPNILLKDDFEPQLSDFGLAMWASTPSAEMAWSNVAGTFGYLAPEYLLCGKASKKIDVYAFGIVLLELLSGRKPINDGYPKGQESLVMWAKPILRSGKYMQLLDPRLGNDFDGQQLEKMVQAAALCIRRAPRFRPQMSLISKLLQGDYAVMKWAKLQIATVEEFDLLYDEASPASDT